MRLNMRLIGILFGILFLTLIGEMLLRSTFYSRHSSRNRDAGKAMLVILIAGVGLLLIGYIGMFFANLIKASISRQREFLADASAVQFTRNPDGIAGALKKIGALSEGSKIAHPMARDASHLFFGSAFKSSAFATHPPLTRANQATPAALGREFRNGATRSHHGRATRRTERRRRKIGPWHRVPRDSPARYESRGMKMFPWQLSEKEAAESMRRVHAEQVDLSHEMLKHMPEPHWIEAAHGEPGAQAIVFALLLAQDEKLRQ